jgi:probable DNA metabolism protein
MTAVFDVYVHKIAHPIIQPASKSQDQLFAQSQEVVTDLNKANRVIKRLKKLCSASDYHDFYRTFLSEITGTENTLMDFCRIVFKDGKSPSGDFGNTTVLKITQTAKMVGREKHRMEAFIRFHLIDDDIYYANCEPDFNVLPLISKHFKNRYADQKWIIYDLKRDYGISYDLNEVVEVTIDFKDPRMQRGIVNTGGLKESRFRESENNYRDLWNQYFKSVNIESRKNMKLHLQHVPKRYWKYLSEKVA